MNEVFNILCFMPGLPSWMCISSVRSSQFGIITFSAFSSHVWLMAALLDDTGLGTLLCSFNRRLVRPHCAPIVTLGAGESAMNET